MRTLLLLTIAWVLAGCSGLIASVSTAPVIGADPCASPVKLPQRALNDREVELYWGRDRRELLDCRDKVEALSGRAP